jgi:hypothetical protein
LFPYILIKTITIKVPINSHIKNWTYSTGEEAYPNFEN